MNEIRLDHKKQLDDLSAQLLVFEASLKARQKSLTDMINHKDQVSKLLCMPINTLEFNYSCCIISYTNELVVFFHLLGCTETAKGDKTLTT